MCSPPGGTRPDTNEQPAVVPRPTARVAGHRRVRRRGCVGRARTLDVVRRPATLVGFGCAGPDAASPGRPAGRCELLDWAASGGMALTGWADRSPRPPPAPLLGRLARLGAALADATGGTGERVEVDLATTLFGRAARLRGRRAGATSVGGSCAMLRAADGWLAVNLARIADVEAVPAVVGRPVTDPWAALAEFAAGSPAGVAAARAQELGIPAAELAAVTPPEAPWQARRLGRPRQRGRRPLVVDLSAMWAGPLAAQLLGRAGARVIKVETPVRPDGTRRGPAAFFDSLHGGHESVAFDFATTDGRASLRQLLGRADVVIESSRPRALAQLGIDAATMVHARPGLTWLSITAYGRDGSWSNRAGFGDDAAVAAGLVARDETGDPVFCGDAIADPVAGLVAALAAVRALGEGGGYLVDVSLAGAAAFLARPGSAPARRHRILEVSPDRWVVIHGVDEATVAAPRAPTPVSPAETLGASTARVMAELDGGTLGATGAGRPSPVTGRYAEVSGGVASAIAAAARSTARMIPW